MWKIEYNNVDDYMACAIGSVEEVGETVDFTPLSIIGTEYNPDTKEYKAKVIGTRDHNKDLDNEYKDLVLFDLVGTFVIPDDGNFIEAEINWDVNGYEILIEGGAEFGANIVEPDCYYYDDYNGGEVVNKHAQLLFEQKVATGFVEESIEMLSFISTKFVRGTEYTYLVVASKIITDNDDMSRSIELLTISDISDEVTRRVILEGVRP